MRTHGEQPVGLRVEKGPWSLQVFVQPDLRAGEMPEQSDILSSRILVVQMLRETNVEMDATDVGLGKRYEPRATSSKLVR
jgi:hypothetical protein